MIYVWYKVSFEGKQCTINDCSFLRDGGIYIFLVDQVALVHSMERKNRPSIFFGGICRECMVICHEYRFRTYRLILGLKMMRVFSTIGTRLLDVVSSDFIPWCWLEGWWILESCWWCKVMFLHMHRWSTLQCDITRW